MSSFFAPRGTPHHSDTPRHPASARALSLSLLLGLSPLAGITPAALAAPENPVQPTQVAPAQADPEQATPASPAAALVQKQAESCSPGRADQFATDFACHQWHVKN